MVINTDIWNAEEAIEGGGEGREYE